MSQTNVVGVTLSETDLTVAGEVLWDATTESFAPMCGVRFENISGETCYIHIKGLHAEGLAGAPSTYEFLAITPSNPVVEIFGIRSMTQSGTLERAEGWSSGGAGVIIWSPCLALEGSLS